MFKLWLIMFIFKLWLMTASCDDVFAKFHQNDYKIRYDRADLVWWNKSVFKQCFIKTFKYNRTLAVNNATFESLVDFGYDLQCIAQVYKLYSNEYRVFPIRLQISFCSTLHYNIGGVGACFKRENPPCPLKKNVAYTVTNFYPDESMLPPLLPNGDFMVEIEMNYLNKKIGIIRAYAKVYRPFIPRY